MERYTRQWEQGAFLTNKNIKTQGRQQGKPTVWVLKGQIVEATGAEEGEIPLYQRNVPH
jgi:hypothetical protein